MKLIFCLTHVRRWMHCHVLESRRTIEKTVNRCFLFLIRLVIVTSAFIRTIAQIHLLFCASAFVSANGLESNDILRTNTLRYISHRFLSIILWSSRIEITVCIIEEEREGQDMSFSLRSLLTTRRIYTARILYSCPNRIRGLIIGTLEKTRTSVCVCMSEKQRVCYYFIDENNESNGWWWRRRNVCTPARSLVLFWFPNNIIGKYHCKIHVKEQIRQSMPLH